MHDELMEDVYVDQPLVYDKGGRQGLQAEKSIIWP